MTKLPRFHLVHDADNGDWKLQNEQQRTVRRFETKSDATAGGVLREALGSGGGTVRIHKEDGPIQEERTYPSSRDPKSSPG
jgi:hypothetical protein